MSKFLCIVSFTDPRIVDRKVPVEGEGVSRKDARRAARAIIGERHPEWEIDQVRAIPAAVADETVTAVRSAGAGKVVAEKGARKAKRGSDPIKKAAAEYANERLAATLSQLHAEGDPEGVARWWVEYRAFTAEARAKAAKVKAAAAK